jgi:hypothetical protein
MKAESISQSMKSMKTPEIELSDNAKSTIARVYKNGGTLKFLAKNIIPRQKFDAYYLSSMIIKDKKEVDYKRLNAKLTKDFSKFYCINNLAKFTIEVLSKSEIEKTLEILEKRMFELLSDETKKNEELFYKRLIILKDFNGFKFVRLEKCYALYHEEFAYLIAFCGSRKQILYTLNPEDRINNECRFGCTIRYAKNYNLAGNYLVKNVKRFSVAKNQFQRLGTFLMGFNFLDESTIQTENMTRFRKLDHLDTL